MWINDSLFLETEIPKLNPLSLEYREYWKEQARRCIQGHWVGGKWMSGNLYFYINFWHILLNKSKNSKVKSMGRPLLMDFLWEMNYYWAEARGFIGFYNDPAVRAYADASIDPDASHETLIELKNELILPRDTLFNSTKDLGAPLYLNEASNLIWMANRGCGKSYWAAGGVIGHEFLFDGRKFFDKELAKYYGVEDGSIPTTEVVVGAGDAKYSGDLLKKTKFGMDNMPGATYVGETFYPSPFSKILSGSWNPGKQVEHLYKKKQGGTWVEAGTRSAIKHRTYKDNPFASQGTRPAVCVKEEIGMFDNLLESHEADVETQQMGTYKFGSTLFMGTGGDMDGGTQDAFKIFYDPETFSCLTFDDRWENRGKIGYFLPATHGKLQYKDKEGNTDYDSAFKSETDKREKLRKGKNASSALDAYIQYNPLVPSEVFLRRTGNIFPKTELAEWLAILETDRKYRDAEFIGSLYQDEEGEVRWKPDLTNDVRPIQEFPIDPRKADVTGGLVIWEHPVKDEDGDVPYGLYIAGTDPYDHDESGTPSLGSTFIYKLFYTYDTWSYLPVAEYTGRPKADEYYRQLLLLLQYYNARCMYENEKKGLHQYAELKGYDYLLMEQPGYIKDILPTSSVQRNKGMHMNKHLKTHGEVLIKNWLEDEIAPGQLQLTKLRSIPLLKELINYNADGNFDRVMAFMMCMYATKERERLMVHHESNYTPIHKSDFFNRAKFKNGPVVNYKKEHGLHF